MGRMKVYSVFCAVLVFSTYTALIKANGIPGITTGPITAIIALVGEKDNVDGVVTMKQAAPDRKVVISGTVTNLPPGKHGFHIVATGDMTGGCYVAGNHYNPYNMTHGAPTDKIRQVGDLGNIVADDDGVAKFNFTDPVVSLYPTTAAFVIGRVLVVHTSYDDMGRGNKPDSKINGNAGDRLACGIIAYQ